MTSLNRLHLNQTIQLAEWLKSQPAYEDGTSLLSIAESASADLPFPVTTWNIKTVAGAAGVSLPASKKPRSDAIAELSAAVLAASERINRLESDMKLLHEMIANQAH